MATKPKEMTTNETVATEPKETTATETVTTDSDVAPTEETKPTPEASAHAGFNKSGKCMTCYEKIRTRTDGAIFCPIAHPKCPRNK